MGSTSQKLLYIIDTGSTQYPSVCHGRILSCCTDGSDLRTVIADVTTMPDGITIDHERGQMYWTNMGTTFKENNGFIERANLDGSNRRTIVPAGTVGVFTPKQITLARRSQKLYWCDREGMKVMRCNLDGSGIEVLLSTGSSAEDRKDPCKWCVGITVDEESGFFYWTQKGPSKGNMGRIFRASIHLPVGASSNARPDLELLFDNLPEPIDLEFDNASQTLFWTDRGDPPVGNSLNRAHIGAKGEALCQREVIAKRLHEAIGLSVDITRKTAYVADLSGSVYAINVATGDKKVMFSELGNITGIALAAF